MDSQVRIQVDYREKKLLEHFDADQIQVQNLAVGDVIITRNDIEEFVIERKTLADLISSIKDNRFREQKSRLHQTFDSKVVVYIIEAYHKETFDSIPQSTIDSAIINLNVIHNFKVFYSLNPIHTTNIIKTLAEKLMEKTDVPLAEYIPIQSIKKSDIYYTNSLACQLSVIPGVSWNTALSLQNEYQCMKNLVDTFDVKRVADMKPGKRRIGHSLANKIKQCIWGTSLSKNEPA